MDVFYYWKNFDTDIAAGGVGAFKTSADKLKEMADGQPDYIWAFRRPKGSKSDLQLLGRLRCAERHGGAYAISFDIGHAKSVQFVDSGSPAAVAEVTDWVSRHFHRMKGANFVGSAGQEAMRGLPLKELENIAAKLIQVPLRPADATA